MVVTQVVRRFGRVGGMESYVWNLCKHLLQLDVSVNLICEEVIEQLPGLAEPNIWLVDKPANVKPRWKAMRHFQGCVEQLIRGEPRARWGIIHSHERLCSHDVTTIHGPLMGNYESLGFFSRLNRRVVEWTMMEGIEVSGLNVRAVFAVSDLARDQLLREYPSARVYSQIMWPGVGPARSSNSELIRDPHKVFFVGREWKRKGLKFAIELVKRLRISFPKMRLHVYGPTFEELPRRVKSYQWIEVHGFQKPQYETCGLLVHPAFDEPFGMVISEARAAGVPCITSQNVGATGLGFDQVEVLSLGDGLEKWVQCARAIIDSADYRPQIIWSWGDLAAAYLEAYETV
jgi:UDP-glucose:(heptosyl)LPS alpha-1,3-glucosyltransferase